MSSRTVLLALLVLAAGLAGCGAKTESSIVGTPELPEVAADRGAIAGLLIDDRFRPIPDAIVLLMPDGLTSTTDGLGQFRFLDLLPGPYVLRVQVADHEAAPRNVDVVAGIYTDIELEARRVFSADGTIITTQYSVFIPCAADYVVNGILFGCIPDTSGDTWRPGFTADTRKYGANVTYLVSEAKMNQVGDYDVQVREDNGQSAGGERYAVGRIVDGDYIRMINQYGVTNTVDNFQNNNHPWNNTKRYATLVFMSGAYRDELQDASKTTCTPAVDDLNRGVGSPVRTCNWRGVGAQFGIKARFVQSLFLGPPTTPIESYRTLG